uniref:Heat shock 70 kDa protein 14 n=1 Tax=Timema genevievae TaxID=629358 RepID=A0A7R9JVJ9_TIMGE|nr:unnamed protein product [Timema genevievae]
MRSAEEAGFDVLQVVSEPSAAVLAYGIGLQDEEELFCLVYRLGGVSLDVTIMQVNSGMYTVCSALHVSHLGGDRFTKILADFLAGEFRQKWKLDPQESRRSMAKLMAAAETCKHVLSTMSTAHCFVESLCEGVDFSCNVSRARFENLIAQNIQEYLQPVINTLEKASLSNSSVSKIIICGGSMKIPKLQKMVSDLFPEATMFSSINPDEVIAVGAAKQASFLSCSFDPDCEHLSMELPAVSKPIFIKLSGQSELKYVIPELSPVPVKRIHTYPVDSGYSEITVELYEKERIDSDTSKLLGKATLTELNGATQISVEVNINNIGGLHMTLTEPKSQIKASLKLDAPS